MRQLVLDASAVMAFFEDCPGAEKVEELIVRALEGKHELLMTAVDWGKVYYSILCTRGEDAAEEILAEVAQLPIEIVGSDVELSKLAAEFRAQHKLPYADCFAAALARQRRATLATADGDFAAANKQVTVLWVRER